MSKNSESLNRSLYDLLRGKGYKPKMLTTAGKATPVPEEASVFIFNFIKDGTDYGQVSASIDGSKKLIVYYDDEVEDSPETNTSGTQVSDSWSALKQHLSQWRFRNGLRSFELKNQDHLEPDMAQREYMRKKESVTEGYHPMGRQASYNDNIPNAKIIIQHSRRLEEGEQRYRNIARIFVENASGERFLIPTTKPGIAQVYARHIAEGGTPYDDKAQHINSLVEEHSKMAGFVRATKNGQFNESTQRLVQEGVNHYQSLRECLSKMRSHRGYQAYFESWTPPLMEDELDESAINELFVQETMDPRIESVLPILSKLQKNLGEAVSMREVSELSEWADSLLEGGDGGEASEEEDVDTDGDAGQGTAGDVDDEENLSEGEHDALNPVGIPEGLLDGSGDDYGPVVNAITRRILLQRVDLLSKYGPDKVAQAIDSVADFVGDVDEIGSSDVSGWIKQVERELSGLAEAPGAETLAHNQSTEAGNLKAFDLEEGIADDYEDMADRELIRHARMLGLEKNIVPDDEGGLANRREIIYLLQQEAEADDLDEESKGLWANIHAKRERIKHGSGEKMRKPGSKGAPTAQNFKDAAKEGVEMDEGEVTRTATGLIHRATDRYGAGEDPDVAHPRDAKDLNRLDKNKIKSLDNSMDVKWKNKGPKGLQIDDEDLEEGFMDTVKKVGSKVLDKLGHGSDDELLKDLQKKAGIRGAEHGKPSMAHSDVEKKVDEELDADQKRVNQLGPTEKVVNNNIGKLVGESQLEEMDSEGYKGTRDSDDEGGKGEGKATPIKAKDMAKKGEKALNKAMDKAHPDYDKHEKKLISKMSHAEKVDKGWAREVKEGQEDLDAILRIIKK